MKDSQTIFVCSDCGEEYLKWQGKCETCGVWNTLKEFKAPSSKLKADSRQIEIINLSKVQIKNFKRISTKISEADRVLGGGLVPGSVVLLAGNPGIGKSTILMQIVSNIKNSFYISGEESVEQIKMRSDRLKVKSSNINIISETNVDAVIESLTKVKPTIVIIDSIQAMYSADFPSTAGSLVQVRESALRLQRFAKENHTPVILVGHVTKEGGIAGPKTLEHMVDVVLYLEGEKYHGTRILRGTKNRFGATDEIGIFEIQNNGLQEIINPSKIFLADRNSKIPGSIVTATVEGTRPFLVEIQALVSQTAFGYPRRTASGFDLNRLQLIIAILINRGSLNLASSDVYLNIAGGFYLKEPAVDLAVALAITTASLKIPVDPHLVVFGELGLGGEIRVVNFAPIRSKEAKRLGFFKTIKAKNIVQAIGEVKNNV